MRASRDEIFGKVALTQGDRALLDAEANLITERGAIQVGTRAREVKRDNEQAALNRFMAENAEAVMLADASTANDLMFTSLDQLDAALENGIMDDGEHEATRQKFVARVAQGRLASMDAEERVAELQRSMSKRKSEGPITQDAIRAGKGSGSIADFLPKDVVAKLLEQAENEKGAEDISEESFSLSDAAVAKYGDGAATQKLREAYIAKHASSAKARKAANQVSRQRFNANRAVESEIQSSTLEALGAMVDEGAGTTLITDLPADQLALLDPKGRKVLDDYIADAKQREGFAEKTQYVLTPDGKSMAHFMNMSPEEQAGQNLDHPEWKTALTLEDWWKLKGVQKAIKSRLESGKGPSLSAGMTNKQMVTAVFPDEESEVHNQVWFQFDAAVQAAQEAKGSKLTNTERRKELADLMLPHGYLDRDLTMHGFVLDEKKPTALMTPEEREKARLPIVKAREETLDIMGVSNNYEDILLEMARLNGIEDPSTKDLERAYFAIKNNMPESEVMRRLGGG